MSNLRVHIASHDTVSAVCAAMNPTHLILIVDHGDSFSIPEVANRLVLSFNDYENGEPHGPDPQHAEAVLGFVATLRQPSDLVVACTYGQSRSAAIALAVSVRRCNPETELFLDIERAYSDLKGHISPNTQLLNHLMNFMRNGERAKLRIVAQHFLKHWSGR